MIFGGKKKGAIDLQGLVSTLWQIEYQPLISCHIKGLLPTNFTSKTRAIIPAAIGDEAEVPVWDEVHLHSTFSDSIGDICQILAILVGYYLIWHIFLLFLVIKIFIILNLPSMKVCCDHFPLTSPERMASKEMQKWNKLITIT